MKTLHFVLLNQKNLWGMVTYYRGDFFRAHEKYDGFIKANLLDSSRETS
jgi:hypothetical protein